MFTCLVREYCQKYELGNIIIYFFKIPIVETAPQGRMEEKSHRTFWRNGPQELPSDDARESFWGVSSGNALLLSPARDRPSSCLQQVGVDRGEGPGRAGWPLLHGSALLPYLLFSYPDPSWLLLEKAVPCVSFYLFWFCLP